MKVLDFLRMYNIPHVTAGRNVKKGNVNICCPFCGDDDSYHMGIDPATGMYGCWRSSTHRGRNFAKVIQQLLNCSWFEATRLSGKNPLLEENEFSSIVDKLFVTEEKIEKKIGGVTSLNLLSEFKKIENSGIRKVFWEYLEGRGFDAIDLFLKKYPLYCCLTGDWKMRIIIPIYFEKKLVTWTARSLYKDAQLKYLDLSIEKSVRQIKNCLYNFDELYEQGGKVLYVTEGPFDGLKVDFYLPKGYRATCIFTKTMTDEQVYLLKKLSTKFSEVRILLDPDAKAEALELEGELSFLKNIRYYDIPAGFKDPGELNKKAVQNLV